MIELLSISEDEQRRIRKAINERWDSIGRSYACDECVQPVKKRMALKKKIGSILKRFKPDGRTEGSPYWILPNGGRTYDYDEWLATNK